MKGQIHLVPLVEYIVGINKVYKPANYYYAYWGCATSVVMEKVSNDKLSPEPELGKITSTSPVVYDMIFNPHKIVPHPLCDGRRVPFGMHFDMEELMYMFGLDEKDFSDDGDLPDEFMEFDLVVPDEIREWAQEEQGVRRIW